jgi:LuxR family maltose regulon positive regulatory protein
MVVPLLTTKLYVPPTRSNLVARPQLIERLQSGLRLGHKLFLISAPAGSGKTTLLGEWIADGVGDARVAWLSVDEDDNDAPRFWTYLVAALQVVQPDLGRDSLRLLETSQLPPIRAILTPLLNNLAALPGRIVLVLDDYHVLSTPAIHEGLAFLLDHQPPQLHLIIATRAAQTRRCPSPSCASGDSSPNCALTTCVSQAKRSLPF